MSDVPEGYYIGHTGEVLLDFRREPANTPKAKHRSRIKSGSKIKLSLFERDGDLCHYCKNKMFNVDPRVNIRAATIEHVVPRAIGGANAKTNLVLACSKCNNNVKDDYIKCDCSFCSTARYIYEGRQ